MKTLVSRNPATGAEIQSYPAHSEREVARRLEAAARAQAAWARRPVAERAALLKAVAAVLRPEARAHAVMMALEMGKPVRQGRAEVEKCAASCEFYARQSEAWLAPEPVSSEAGRSYVCFEPLGVVLGIMPWNFPFWQVFRAAVPALAAGNALVFKHASNVTGCALAIEAAFRRAGFPEGLVSTLLIESKAARRLIGHPVIRGVTLTGSTEAGRSVAAAAGKALKKAVLELGGSDAYLVLKDADTAQAAKICGAARLVNSGQSCIAAKRFIAHTSVAAEFTAHLVREMAGQRVGNPLEETTEIGPLARPDLRDELHNQVERSVAAGAKLVLGGEVPAAAGGAFYPATVLAGVRPGMAAFDEETFGPVAAIIEVETEEEAIRLANQSSFGLGAAVFTRDAARGEEIAARRLEAGCCFVNEMVRSDPRFPFGGVKASGFGRELSHFGLREFVNVKTVWVK